MRWPSVSTISVTVLSVLNEKVRAAAERASRAGCPALLTFDDHSSA